MRKNDVIWIHDRELGLSPLEPDYETMNNLGQFDELKKIKYDIGERKAGYLETMDRNGQTAYVKKSHVKIIYKDDREFQTNVNPFIEDPTDYRLQEPLPSDYPLTDPEKRRATLMSIFGPALRSRYSYNLGVTSTERKFRKGLAFGYSRKANWDQFNRFYFGGYAHVLVSEASYTFNDNGVQDSEISEEISYQFSIGPELSYDVFRKEKWKLSVGGGININWNRHFVKISEATIGDEERLFQGINFTPRAFSKFHWKNFLVPGTDLVFGVDMQFQLAQQYEPSGAALFQNLWTEEGQNEEEVYKTPTGGVLSFLIGFQSNY